MYSAGFKRRAIAAWMGAFLVLGRTAAGAAEEGGGVELTLPPLFAAAAPAFELRSMSAGEIRPLLALEVEQEGLKKERRKRLGSLFYLGAGLALSTGVVALWTKREADRAYDDYLHTANQQRQKERFDRAEDRDRISGAAFIAMEVGLVLTTYTLFF